MRFNETHRLNPPLLPAPHVLLSFILNQAVNISMQQNIYEGPCFTYDPRGKCTITMLIWRRGCQMDRTDC